MTTETRFSAAYAAWRADPVELTDASRALWEVSQSAVSAQEMVADVLHIFNDTGTPTPPPVDLTLDRWNDGASYLISRRLSTLRRMQQTGRQQVATRQLMLQTERLKEVWDAYRAATGH